jgi:PDZ domain
MRTLKILLAAAILTSGCVSSRTIGDLTLLPLSPIAARELVWQRPSIQWISPFSPAGAAGLAVGDLLVAWNGKAVHDIGESQRLLHAGSGRSDVEVTYSRDGVLRKANLHRAAESNYFGFDTYPLDSTYSLVGFPNLPREIAFLKFGSAQLSLYVAYFSDNPEVLLLRFQIENTRQGVMNGPSGVEVLDPAGNLFRYLSSGDAVGYLLPLLGSQTPYAPYVPYRPPGYEISPGGRYLSPQNDSYTAAANGIIAIGNIITSVNNARKAQREVDRQTLYNRLAGEELHQRAIPSQGRDVGIVLARGTSTRPIRVSIMIENEQHMFSFD